MLKNHYQIHPLAGSDIIHSLLISKQKKPDSFIPLNTMDYYKTNWSSQETSLQYNSSACKAVIRRHMMIQINEREKLQRTFVNPSGLWWSG